MSDFIKETEIKGIFSFLCPNSGIIECEVLQSEGKWGKRRDYPVYQGMRPAFRIPCDFPLQGSVTG
jgi:hypothetical protein